MAARTDGLCGLLDELDRNVGARADVRVKDVVEKLGHRGFGPLIAIPALVATSLTGKSRMRSVNCVASPAGLTAISGDA